MTKYIQENFPPPIMVAFGNPLMDICVGPPPAGMFEKYNLIVDGQVEFEATEFLSLLQEVEAKMKERAVWPGGSIQNTVRLLQWLIGTPGYIILYGAVGVDENGKFLEEYVAKSGAITKYVYHKDYQTGACLTFVNGESRSLAAHLGAANFCPIDIDLKEHTDILKNVKLACIEGFFITHGYPIVKKILDICNEYGTCFGVNLSAAYICEKFGSEMNYLVENAHVICGNITEYLALCKSLNWAAETGTDVAIAIQKVSKRKCRSSCSKQFNEKKKLPRLLLNPPIIIITDGKRNVIVSQGPTDPPVKYPVCEIAKDLVKDTTGAGDAFLAGFLGALFCDYDMDVCVEWGYQTASIIIQDIGVKTPQFPPPWI